MHFVQYSEILMKKGFYKSVEKLIEFLAKIHINISNDLKLLTNSIKKDLDALVILASTKKEAETVTPVFQWA